MQVNQGVNFFSPGADLLGNTVELQRTKYLPEQIVQRYIAEAIKLANVRKLDDGSFFAEIPDFVGVWASNPDLSCCGAELRDVLFDWLVIKIEQNDRDIPILPAIPDINLNVI